MSQAKRPLIPLSRFPSHLQKFVSDEAPAAAAKLVIQGLVPADGAIRICALYQVAHLHQELYSTAGIALAQVPSQDVVSGLEQLPPPIIDWVSEVCIRDPDCAAAILAHPRVATSTLMRLLSIAEEKVAVQLAQNQVKLMGNSTLLQSLCLNPNLPSIVEERLIELAKYEQVDLSWLPRSQTPPSPTSVTAVAPESTEERGRPDDTLPNVLSASSALTSSHGGREQHIVGAVGKPLDKVKSSLSLVTDEGRAPEVRRLQWHPLSMELFPAPVQKFLVPDAPSKVLKLIFSGLVPMPVETRVLALYHLSVSRKEVIGAIEAVRGIGIENLIESLPAIESPATLDWLADHCLGIDENPHNLSIEGGAELITALASHRFTAEETISRIALLTDGEGCERIALNQQRLLSQPSIIHALYYNPSFSTVQADQLLELAAREGVDLSWLPDAAEVITELSQSSKGESTELNEALQQAIRVGKEEDPKEAAINAVLQEHAARRAADKPEEEAGKPKKGYALVQSLNVAQKIRLALLGSQSNRALLVKDSNKVVSRAAIRSPAVSVSEALLYARNHSLNASIIEYIARNRKWMQNYRLKVQIILNPKTPINISLTALTTLRPAELRAVAQSHNVSGVVSQKAKDLIKKRQG